MDPFDSLLLYQYKNGMKYPRLVLGLCLAAAIMACSIFPNIPSISIGETATPSQTSTPAPTLTPTITPTPLPTARVAVGDRAFFNGDYDSALNHYQIAFQESPDPQISRAAKMGEARVLYPKKTK